MAAIGHALAPIMARLQRRATLRDAMLRFTDERVSIGDARVPARRIVPVGDVDGNGIGDVVVANPTALSRRGVVRLYLLRNALVPHVAAKYFYSRELLPGTGGLAAVPQLSEGCHFGAAVVRLPQTQREDGVMLAVSAPGEGVAGVVYVIRLSKKGDVAKFAKAHLAPTGAASPSGKKGGSMVALSGGKKQRGVGAMRKESLKAKQVKKKKEQNVLRDVNKIAFEAADGETLATLMVDSEADAALLSLVRNELLM